MRGAMPNRVQKLPITAYDILGYLVPGATFFALSLYAWHGLTVFEKITLAPSSLGGASLVLISIVLSYVAGHGLALFSSFTIERLVINFFGYPSNNLISRTGRSQMLANVLAKKLTAMVATFFTPLTSVLLAALWSTGFVFHFIKPLDDYAIELLNKKFSKRYGRDLSEIAGADWFNIVQHDVMSYSQIGAARMYNYLNLYGFCRNMAFTMSALFALALCRIIFSDAALPQHYKLFVFGLIFASWLLSLGFIKFFRRYSQEAIMVFIVSQDERDKAKTPFQGLSSPHR